MAEPNKPAADPLAALRAELEAARAEIATLKAKPVARTASAINVIEIPDGVEFVRVNTTRPTFYHLPDVLQFADVEQSTDPLAKLAAMLSGRGNAPPMGIGTGHSLKPGGNNVRADYIRQVLKHRDVQAKIALGWITIGGDVAQPEGIPAPQTLGEYTESATLCAFSVRITSMQSAL